MNVRIAKRESRVSPVWFKRSDLVQYYRDGELTGSYRHCPERDSGQWEAGAYQEITNKLICKPTEPVVFDTEAEAKAHVEATPNGMKCAYQPPRGGKV